MRKATIRRCLRWVGPALLTAAYATIASAQCSMCRATLLTSREAQAFIGGLRQGTVLLLAVPFVIVGLVWARLRRAGIIAKGRSSENPGVVAPR